jgi:hypothetical protein
MPEVSFAVSLGEAYRPLVNISVLFCFPSGFQTLRRPVVLPYILIRVKGPHCSPFKKTFESWQLKAHEHFIFIEKKTSQTILLDLFNYKNQNQNI